MRELRVAGMARERAVRLALDREGWRDLVEALYVPLGIWRMSEYAQL